MWRRHQASRTDPAAEAKRTRCSIDARRYIHEGGDEAYEAFTRHQPKTTRLTRAEFNELSAWERSVVADEETAVAADMVMLLHDICKSGRVYEAMGLRQHEVDHDEALRLLLHDEQYAAARQQLLPSIERLTLKQWDLVQEVLGIPYNYPQALQGEAPAADELDIPHRITPQARDLFILHAMLDIAGAAGHIQPEGSVTLNSPAYRRMCNLNAALQDASLPDSGARNSAFLDAEIRHFTGEPAPEDPVRRRELRALARLGCLMRVETQKDFDGLRQAFDGQHPAVKAILNTELNRTASTRATLLYHSPALLREVAKKEGNGFALMYLAHLLQEAHIVDKEARMAGQPGIVTVHLGDLVQKIISGGIDPRQTPIRFRTREGGLVPEVYRPTLYDTEGLPDFSDGGSLRGKRIIVIGAGGGSDGNQAAMVAKLAAAKYGCTVAGVVSTRNEKRQITGSGRRIGQTVREITPDSRPVGSWRFLENTLLEGDSPAPAYLLNSSDPNVIQADIEALMAETGADAIIGVDTGGDSLYRNEHAGFSAFLPTDITPDHDYMSIQALDRVAASNPDVPVLSVIVAPGVDTPSYAREVLDEIGARRMPLTDEDIQRIQQTYATWGMDGSGSERGRYGKTPLAWLHALRGNTGLQLLDLPRANVVSNDNPWRAFAAITPAMAGIVIANMRDHFAAINRDRPE